MTDMSTLKHLVDIMKDRDSNDRDSNELYTEQDYFKDIEAPIDRGVPTSSSVQITEHGEDPNTTNQLINRFGQENLDAFISFVQRNNWPCSISSFPADPINEAALMIGGNRANSDGSYFILSISCRESGVIWASLRHAHIPNQSETSWLIDRQFDSLPAVQNEILSAGKQHINEG
jgi:hypothetical protein